MVTRLLVAHYVESKSWGPHHFFLRDLQEDNFMISILISKLFMLVNIIDI